MEGRMTSGERAVWAAEFVRGRGMGCPVWRAVEMASEAVYSLQVAKEAPIIRIDADARAMLADILGTGAAE
jgi:hypothetical protein